MKRLCALFLFHFSSVTALLLLVIFSAVGGAATAPLSETIYYMGEVRITAPDGASQGSSVSIGKRTVDPKQHTISEDVVHIPSAGLVKEYVTSMKVDGNHFTMKEQEGNYTGMGSLTGVPWHWNKWDYTAKLPLGTLRAHHERTENALTGRREFFDDHGKLRLIYSEDLKIITREMFEVLHARFTKPVKRLG